MTRESPNSRPRHRVIWVYTLQFISRPSSTPVASSTSQSATRPRWSCGSGTAMPLSHRSGPSGQTGRSSIHLAKGAGTHPVKVLPSSSRLWKYRRPSSMGNRPDNWLPSRCSTPSRGMRPSTGGIGPVRSLRARCNCVSCVSRPNSGGIEPVRRLSLRRSSVSCARFPSSGGIEPVSALEDRFSRVSPASWPSSGGIGPVKRLSWRSSNVSWVKRPNSGGIGPVRSLRARCNCVSCVSRPNPGGMDPVSASFSRYNFVTREPETRMLSHSVMGTSALQFRAASPASGSRTLSSTSQSAARPGCSCGSGTAMPLAHGLGPAGSCANTGIAQESSPLLSRPSAGGKRLATADLAEPVPRPVSSPPGPGR